MCEVQNNTKIFIGGLSFETTDEKLKDYFERWGEVIDAIVMTDNVSKRSRGFGFITYADSFSVDHVLLEQEHFVDGRRVEAKRAVPRSDLSANAPVFSLPLHEPLSLSRATSNDLHSIECPSSNSDGSDSGFHDINSHSGAKIFVGGLHYETRDNIFRSYFEQFGNVLAAEVMFNRETHKSRGFGFVVFESIESATAVLQHPHHSIDGKLVEVKRAVPRVVPNHSPTYLSPETTPTRHRVAALQGFADSFVIEEKYMNLGNQHVENITRLAAVAAAAAVDSYAAAIGFNHSSNYSANPSLTAPNVSNLRQCYNLDQVSSSLPSLSYLRTYSSSTASVSPNSMASSLPLYESWDSLKPLSIPLDKNHKEKLFSDIWDLHTSSDTEKEESALPIFESLKCTSVLPREDLDDSMLSQSCSPNAEELEKALADLSLCATRNNSSSGSGASSFDASMAPWLTEFLGSDHFSRGNLSFSCGGMFSSAAVELASEVTNLDSTRSSANQFLFHSKSLRLEDDIQSDYALKVCEPFF